MRTSIAAFAFIIVGALPVVADPMQTCKSGPTFESRIMACTEVIDARTTREALRVSALGARGQHLAQINQWEAALADLDQAIALGSRDPEVFDARGRTLAEAASIDHAARDFESAVSLAPASPRYLVHRGRAYGAMGDAARARQDLERAQRMDAEGAMRQAIEEALAALK
jgi:tetratricopeptide (TPR) repeat protein